MLPMHDCRLRGHGATKLPPRIRLGRSDGGAPLEEAPKALRWGCHLQVFLRFQRRSPRAPEAFMPR